MLTWTTWLPFTRCFYPQPTGTYLFREISNRGHFSDSERFISTCNDLQEHGRHPKSLQDNIRHCNCVPRCVPRVLNSGYHVLIETHGSDVGSTPFQIFFPVLRLIPDDQ